jgi:methionine aminopeptidase
MTNPDQIRLTSRQHLAIDALLSGATHTDAATASGVARTTVTGWSNHNVHFIAELMKRRQQRAEQLSDCIAEALTAAIAVIHAEIEDGDVKAAVALIRAVERTSLYRPPRQSRVSSLSVTRELANQLETDLILDAHVSGHAVFAIEDLSDAHQDHQTATAELSIDK